MKLMTSLVEVTAQVEKSKEVAEQLYETEKRKHQSKKANDRLTGLQHKKTEV